MIRMIIAYAAGVGIGIIGGIYLYASFKTEQLERLEVTWVCDDFIVFHDALGQYIQVTVPSENAR